MIKQFIKTILTLPLDIFNYSFMIYDKIICNIFPQMKGVGRQKIINAIDNDIKLIKHGAAKFYLYTPNGICDYRHNTFSTKEPEMLEWIDEYGGGVFFDVGASIGIYSLYYAATQQGSVYSFEPSPFNLRQLVKNICKNKMTDRITVVTNPLTYKTDIAAFINGSSEEGAAMNAFGVSYGQDAKPINSDIKYNMIGFSLDDLIEKNILKETPSLIKIDVDGIEHLILKGAVKTLRSEKLKSIYIEVNDDFEEQSSQVKIILESAGFKLKEKRHAEMFVTTNIFNQIWVKK